MSQQRDDQRIVVTVGFAAGELGGVAYGALQLPGEDAVVRAGFTCRPAPALQGRDIAYAALHAVAGKLLARGLGSVELRTEDRNVPVDLAERRTLPAALTIPYVALRCTLNRFTAAAVITATGPLSRDLTARARAEAFLDVAA